MVTLRIDDTTAAEWSRAARLHGLRSRSELVRRAVAFYAENAPRPKPKVITGVPLAADEIEGLDRQ